MTRSTKVAPSARDVYTKTVRAEAHSKGITFAAACLRLQPARQGPLLGNSALATGPFSFQCNCLNERNGPPNPVSKGRSSYNSKTYISGPQVDDGGLDLEDEDVYDFQVDFCDEPALPRPAPQSVSILDLARPAKKRGPAKEFEVVPRVRNVVVLEDNDDIGSFYLPSTLGGDEEWERISDEQSVDSRRQYAAVLRGPDT